MDTNLQGHVDYLQAEKGILKLEDSDKTGFLRTNCKHMKFQGSCVVENAKRLVLAMHIFESDLGCTFLLNTFLESIAIDLYARKAFSEGNLLGILHKHNTVYKQ